MFLCKKHFSLLTPHDRLLFAGVNMCISIPSGASGCLLKSWAPFNTVQAHTFGLVLDCRNRLTCMSIWGNSWHHKPKGQVLGKPHSTPIACDFHVCIARSAMFLRCIPLGTNSNVHFWFSISSLNSSEISLSKICLLTMMLARWKRFIILR